MVRYSWNVKKWWNFTSRNVIITWDYRLLKSSSVGRRVGGSTVLHNTTFSSPPTFTVAKATTSWCNVFLTIFNKVTTGRRVVIKSILGNVMTIVSWAAAGSSIRLTSSQLFLFSCHLQNTFLPPVSHHGHVDKVHCVPCSVSDNGGVIGNLW